MRALFAVLVGVDRPEGRAFGDRAVMLSETVIDLVRQGFCPAELSAAFGLSHRDGERAFMASLSEIDRAAAVERRRRQGRAANRKWRAKKLAASPQIPRCNSQD